MRASSRGPSLKGTLVATTARYSGSLESRAANP